jgi:hypothetical protein
MTRIVAITFRLRAWRIRIGRPGAQSGVAQ